MTTKLITVTPGDTLSHAANLLRQYQFHHLPVVKADDSQRIAGFTYGRHDSPVEFEGLLTSHDIDLAAAVGSLSSSDVLHQPWQERRVVDVMQRDTLCVAPTTTVAAAAQILVERGLNALPVVEYERADQKTEESEQANRTVLVGLLTRSDLLMALARLSGAFEPGMDLTIELPPGDASALAQTLLLAAELHVQVRSVIAGPPESGVLRLATVRLGTINPAPLLVRLQEAGVHYTFAPLQIEGDVHA